jgi:GDP-4-dehydro-6-deoxy-D-mannose reductase
MRVLITGGTGFVGPYLVSELCQHGHSVDVPEYPEFDVTKPETIAAAFDAAPDAVVHLAAIAHPATAHSNPAAAFEVAVAGTVNVLERARANRSHPFVLVISSSDVYGRPNPEDLPLTESAPLRPTSAYALAKVAQESVALAYFTTRGVRGAVARSFNHSGPGQTTQYVIPALASRVVEAKRAGMSEIRVGNLDVRRDFLHVGDVARAYRLLIEAGAAGNPAVLGGVLNVAVGTAVPIRDIFERLCELASVRLAAVADPALMRADDIPSICGDPSRIAAAVGWRPERTLDDLLADVLSDVARGPVAIG